MPGPLPRTLLAAGVLLTLCVSNTTEAQIVRRFAGGGLQVNAPLVRVNVGPGGTSVRAPFTSVDPYGRVVVGRRGRFRGQPPYAPPQHPANVAPTYAAPAQQPEVADVDTLSYPTAGDLVQMDDQALVETLRQMMARLHYRLSLLKTGEGWQEHLVLSREVLGSPGAPAVAVPLEAIQRVLPRYEKVQAQPAYAKIAALPSFVATYQALQEVASRPDSFPATQATGAVRTNTTESNQDFTLPTDTPAEEIREVLPVPKSSRIPNARRGERSILKRR